MDEQYRKRVDERAMELIRSGEYDHLVIPDRGARLGRIIRMIGALAILLEIYPYLMAMGILYHTYICWNLVTSLITLDQNLEIYLKSHRQMIERISHDSD